MEELPSDAAVLVLLVATDAAQWLPETIRGIKAQDHPQLEVLAVDNASADGSGNVLLKAFGAQSVISLERRVGYGRALATALRVAVDRAIVADVIMLVHDDAELYPEAVVAMLDAMRVQDVGIVGAKLVEWSDASLLQDIGQTCDRYGRAVPRVERGELDQGQHDGFHDVLYVTSAAMMISRRVIEDVGFFDLRYVQLRDDLDLCWRARLAGFKTVVTTDAVVRHASASTRGARPGPVAQRMRYFAERNMIATLIKNYGAARLAFTLPVTILISLFNTVLFFATGRRRAALQTLEALQWNLAHIGSTVRGRIRAQRRRTVRDGRVTTLMHHGATRLRAQFERALELVVGDIVEGEDDDDAALRPPPTVLQRLKRHPSAASVLIALIVGTVGARTLFFTGHMAGADLPPFPSGSGDLFREFMSGWRGAAHGGAAPATPGLALMSLLSFLSFGSTWFAERALVLGLPVLGALLMFRLARAIGLPTGARRLSAIAYLVSPLMLGAFGAGRLGDLVLLAAAPGLVMSLLRISGSLPLEWKHLAAAALGLAVTASLSPWALAFVAGLAIILAARPGATRGAILRRTAGVIATSLALLFPWSIELFRSGSPLGAGGFGSNTTMRELLGLSPGSVQPIPEPLWYGMAAGAVAAIVIARGAHERIVTLFGWIALAGLAVAYAVARGVPWIAPRASLPLVAAAVAVAALLGVAFASAGPLLSVRSAGLVHVVAGLIGVLVVAQIGAGALWAASGRHPGIEPAGTLLPAFIEIDARAEPYRIAWIGSGPGGTLAALTGPGGATMEEYLARPAGGAHRALLRAVTAIEGGSTVAGGRALGTLGVRYVIVRPGTARRVAAAFDRQVDLQFAQRFRGAMIYQNEAALPIAAMTSADRTDLEAIFAATGPEAAGAIAPASARALRRTGSQRFAGSADAKARAVLIAEDFTPRWKARIASRDVKAVRAFGWATAFRVPGAGAIAVAWRGNTWHRAALALEVLILLVFVGEWSRRAARDRGER